MKVDGIEYEERKKERKKEQDQNAKLEIKASQLFAKSGDFVSLLINEAACASCSHQEPCGLDGPQHTAKAA